LGTLVRQKWITMDELEGLSEDKLVYIQRVVDLPNTLP
jgi:hypothetical protein